MKFFETKKTEFLSSFFFFFLFKSKKGPDFTHNVHPDFRLKMDKGITANVDSFNTRRVSKRDLVD